MPRSRKSLPTITGQTGITVMEILVLLTVTVIIAALGTPWILNTIQTYRVRGAAWEVAGDLRLARQKAVSTQVRHRFCIANCDTAPPAGGYLLEREQAGTWVVDLTRSDIPNGVDLSMLGPVKNVTYDTKGDGSGGTITLTDNTVIYEVKAAASGRVRVCKGSCPP